MYSQALAGGGAPAPGGPGAPPPAPMPNPADQIPQTAPMPRVPANENPMTQQGDIFFLDPSMLPDGDNCKVGDEIMLKASIQSKGSKIGLQPIEVVMESDDEDQEDDEGATGGEDIPEPPQGR